MTTSTMPDPARVVVVEPGDLDQVLALVDVLRRRQRHLDGGGGTLSGEVLSALRRLAEAVERTSESGPDQDWNATMVMRDDRLPVGEVAATCGLSGRHLRRLATAGRIAGRKHGGIWLLDADDVARHLRGEPPDARSP